MCVCAGMAAGLPHNSGTEALRVCLTDNAHTFGIPAALLGEEFISSVCYNTNECEFDVYIERSESVCVHAFVFNSAALKFANLLVHLSVSARVCVCVYVHGCVCVCVHGCVYLPADAFAAALHASTPAAWSSYDDFSVDDSVPGEPPGELFAWVNRELLVATEPPFRKGLSDIVLHAQQFMSFLHSLVNISGAYAFCTHCVLCVWVCFS
jgi:hypothetical protein